MNFARIILAIAAFYLGVLGITFLFVPSTMANTVDLSILGAFGGSELRTIYGGLELAIAAYFILAFLEEDFLAAATMLVVFVFAGLLIGRIVSLVGDGMPHTIGLGLILVELLLLVFGFLAVRAIQNEGRI